MLLTLLVLGLAVAVIAVVEGNPVEWGRDRYHDLIDKKVVVSGVAVIEEPEDQPTDVVTDTDPSTLWEMPRPDGAPATTGCEPVADRLRFELDDPVRVRGLRVQPGKRAGDTTRLLSPRPATLLVWWEAGGKEQCDELPVEDDAASRDLAMDTDVEVDKLWVSVGSVHPAKNATEERPVGIRKLELLARP